MSEYTLSPSCNFNKIGMSCHCFEQLLSCVQWSNQYVHRQEGMSHAKHFWKIVLCFVDRFNDHRPANYFPSDILCAYEYMSKWNLFEEFCINIGLPSFVAMNQNPSDGCEVQNICYARSRVMI